MRYMLDTDTASYLIKDPDSPVRDRLRERPPETVLVSAMTAAELLYGLQRLSNEDPLQLAVRRLLQTIMVIPWDESAAERYAEIRHRLTTTGREIGTVDMMIAAHATSLGATLVTNNPRHFERVGESLMLENWH